MNRLANVMRVINIVASTAIFSITPPQRKRVDSRYLDWVEFTCWLAGLTPDRDLILFLTKLVLL